VAYWVGFAVWGGVFGTLVAVGLWRYATRGPWQERGVARVLRVWEADPAKGWGNGVPAEVSFVDPVTGHERVGVTHGGGGRCGLLGAAWPGREVEVWVRTRRPDIFRVVDEPARLILRHGAFGVPAAALLAFPLFWFALGGRGGVEAVLLLSFGTVWTALTLHLWAGERREAGRRTRVLRAETVPTTGKVIGIRESRKMDDDRSFVASDTPVVAFTTRDGLDVTAICRISWRTNVEHVGAEVPLIYAASEPDLVAVARRPDAHADGGALLAAVIACLLAGAAALTAGVTLVLG
jgi:hypothetical protein